MPPCNKDKINYVVAEPIRIASEILDLAREALKIPNNKNKKKVIEVIDFSDEINVDNHRNIQDKRNRPVFFYDHLRCNGNIENVIKKKKIEGHYEKKTF